MMKVDEEYHFVGNDEKKFHSSLDKVGSRFLNHQHLFKGDRKIQNIFSMDKICCPGSIENI